MEHEKLFNIEKYIRYCKKHTKRYKLGKQNKNARLNHCDLFIAQE